MLTRLDLGAAAVAHTHTHTQGRCTDEKRTHKHTQAHTSTYMHRQNTVKESDLALNHSYEQQATIQAVPSPPLQKPACWLVKQKWSSTVCLVCVLFLFSVHLLCVTPWEWLTAREAPYSHTRYQTVEIFRLVIILIFKPESCHDAYVVCTTENNEIIYFCGFRDIWGHCCLIMDFCFSCGCSRPHQYRCSDLPSVILDRVQIRYQCI